MDATIGTGFWGCQTQASQAPHSHQTVQPLLQAVLRSERITQLCALRHPAIPDAKGNFKGVGSPMVVQYIDLRSCGVTGSNPDTLPNVVSTVKDNN